MIAGFELQDDGDLLPDDAAERDDIAAQQGELLDDAPGFGGEEGVFDGVHALVDLVEDGEDVIDELIDEGVQGVIGALPQQLGARAFVRPAALAGLDEGLERAVMHGDDIIAPEEEIDFAGAGELVAGIPKREVHDKEEVVVGLVELGAFDGTDDVFEVERMEGGIASLQGGDVFGGGVDDVDPGGGVVGDDVGAHGGDSTLPIAMGGGLVGTRTPTPPPNPLPEASGRGLNSTTEQRRTQEELSAILVFNWKSNWTAKYFLSNKAGIAVLPPPEKEFFRRFGDMAETRFGC